MRGNKTEMLQEAAVSLYLWQFQSKYSYCSSNIPLLLHSNPETQGKTLSKTILIFFLMRKTILCQTNKLRMMIPKRSVHDLPVGRHCCSSQ